MSLGEQMANSKHLLACLILLVLLGTAMEVPVGVREKTATVSLIVVTCLLESRPLEAFVERKNTTSKGSLVLIEKSLLLKASFAKESLAPNN